MEQELAQAIELISAQLGIAVERVFGMFVSAQVLIGIIDIISIIIVLVLAFATWWTSKRMITPLCKDEDGDWNDADDKICARIAPVVIGLVSLMIWGIIVGEIGDAALKIVCPEYSAMQEIIGLVMP